MLSDYLSQTATLKSVSSVNDSNEKTYSTSTIVCRFIFKRQVIRGHDEDIVSDGIVYTETALQEGDVIYNETKNWKIRHIYPWIDLDGNVIGYKGVL